MSSRRAYAVSWSEDGGTTHVGKLELQPTRALLDGRGVVRSAPYASFRSVVGARISGHRATVIVLRDGTRITLTSLDGPGALTELEHELKGRR